MRNLIIAIALATFLPVLAQAQTKYKIVVLGSSSAFGVGASVPDSSWVGRTKAYYKSQGQLDTIINLAVPGSFSDSGVKLLPKALGYAPDIVLVAFPSNDIVAGLGVPLLMRNLRKIYNTVTASGAKCFVSTTQPRNDPNAGPLLKVGRDSVVKEFPDNFMQFYDPLVAPGSYNINPLYSAEGVHPNNMGHRLLFQSVLAAHIIPAPTRPPHVKGFSGLRTDIGVVLNWIVADSGINMNFFVGRSTDGISFENRFKEIAISDSMLRQYSFTDQEPLPARSFYRIGAAMDGYDTTYSDILVVEAAVPALAIEKVYIAGLDITTTIDIPKDEIFRLAIFNTGGVPIQLQSYSGRAPVVTLDIPLPSLPAGIYYLEIATSDGHRAIKAFTIL
jgi:lysophospholipase L1-like esterase